MTREEKARAYDEAKARISRAFNNNRCTIDFMNEIFPELKESEDEKMVKFIKTQLFNIKKTITENYELDAKLTKAIEWLEKQAGKDKLIQELGEYKVKYTQEVISQQLEKQVGQKLTDNVEPKFKVRYAGGEYNVLEVKDIAGVTFYGIEDEPNHIDYVKADNCEIISGYGIKENGYPYPTKPSMFSEQKPAWSGEDERNLEGIIDEIQANKNQAPDYDLETYDRFLSWLKSLKQRIGG